MISLVGRRDSNPQPPVLETGCYHCAIALRRKTPPDEHRIRRRFVQPETRWKGRAPRNTSPTSLMRAHARVACASATRAHDVGPWRGDSHLAP